MDECVDNSTRLNVFNEHVIFLFYSDASAGRTEWRHGPDPARGP